MTLLWADSYNTYGDVDNDAPDPGTFPTKYARAYHIAYGDWRSSGRYLAGAYETAAQPYHTEMTTQNVTTNATMIAGIAIWPYSSYANTGDNDWPILCFESGTTKYVELALTVDGLLLKNGSGTVLGVARYVFYKQDWNYIEMKAYCHDTNGTVEVRINGCPVISVSNVDTKNGSNAYFTRCSIGDNRDVNNFAYGKIDDFYVCDGAGSKNNDFLGPSTAVACLFPDGDSSVNFATTGNANYANHYQQVGYTNALWTTDYVEDSTTGNRDIFTLDASPNFNDIYGVIGWVLAEGRTSTQNYHQVISSNGTETESSNFTVTVSSNTTSRFVVEDDPDTSNAWTPATVNAALFGIELQ
jgi:hypothetical protein